MSILNNVVTVDKDAIVIFGERILLSQPDNYRNTIANIKLAGNKTVANFYDYTTNTYKFDNASKDPASASIQQKKIGEILQSIKSSTRRVLEDATKLEDSYQIFKQVVEVLQISTTILTRLYVLFTIRPVACSEESNTVEAQKSDLETKRKEVDLLRKLLKDASQLLLSVDSLPDKVFNFEEVPEGQKPVVGGGVDDPSVIEYSISVDDVSNPKILKILGKDTNVDIEINLSATTNPPNANTDGIPVADVEDINSIVLLKGNQRELSLREIVQANYNCYKVMQKDTSNLIWSNIAVIKDTIKLTIAEVSKEDNFTAAIESLIAKVESDETAGLKFKSLLYARHYLRKRLIKSYIGFVVAETTQCAYAKDRPNAGDAKALDETILKLKALLLDTTHILLNMDSVGTPSSTLPVNWPTLKDLDEGLNQKP